MSADRSEDKSEFVVDVKAERLYQIVQSIIDGGMASEVISKFGGVTVTLALKDAESIKSFIVQAAKTRRASSENMVAASRVEAAMPLDFGHCTRRPV